MSGDHPTVMRRLVIRIWALLPEDWRGAAGERFRNTTAAITEYAEQNVRLGERVDEAPDLAWRAVQGAATQKHSEAVLNYAKEENERVRAEFERRTLEARVRKEVAEARKVESEARTLEIRELEARIELVDKLRRAGALPIALPDGRMAIIKAPASLDWDEMVSGKLITADEQERMFSVPVEPTEIRSNDSIGVSIIEATSVADEARAEETPQPPERRD